MDNSFLGKEVKTLYFRNSEYDDKKVLNKVVNFGYNPMIKKTKKGARGYGAKKRDKIFNKEVYKRRSICEGSFGALANRFGDRVFPKMNYPFTNFYSKIGHS